MSRLINWFNLIIKKQKGLKRWQRIVTVLAAMITFATTYALILPAITVEKNSTEDVGGMYLEKTAERDDLMEENALEPVGVSIAADMDNAAAFAYADDDLTATAIFSTDEVIPEGSELVVNLVDPASDEYAVLREKSEGFLDKEFIYDVTTCSFYDYALICENVDVTPKAGLADIQIIFRNNTVEHINDMVYAGRFARPAEEDGFAALTAVEEDAADELVSVNPDESSVLELNDGIITSLSLKGNDLARSDSIVGILAGNVDEEIKAAAAETDAEIPDSDETLAEDSSNSQDENTSNDSEEDGTGTHANADEITTALPVKTLKASGSDYTVTLTYDESSKIPEGASLAVSEISKDSKEYQTYLAETKKAMGLTEEETLPSFAARFFDIKIMVDGQEFTPDSGVSVEITYAEPLAEYSDTEVNAVHFADEKAEAEVIEANTAEIQDDGNATVEFTAETFSVYGVIYTVDFHWEVDGKTYDYSIPGGGFVTLQQLVEALGIVNSDKSREFVADVEDIEFSDPELVWAGKAEIDSTVEGLKDVNGLNCQYSPELTDAQIIEINAQTVQRGEWVLISIRPFLSEESLTVTMKNGEQCVIKVSDEQEIFEIESINVNNAYILCTYQNGKYYVLKTDGTTTDEYTPEDFDKLGNDYKWTFYYVFEEKDETSINYGRMYYLIRPISDKSMSIALNAVGEDLIQGDPNNIAILPQNGTGFIFEGYSRKTLNVPKLYYNGTDFTASLTGSSTIRVYRQEPLETYDFTVISDDYDMGTVSTTGTPHYQEVEDENGNMVTTQNVYYITETDESKKNAYAITANPINIVGKNDSEGHATHKYDFDHWELDGETLYQQDSDGNYILDGNEEKQLVDATISAGTITIPENSSVLKAVFAENPDYIPKDEDKTGTSFDDMSKWLTELTERPLPLNPEGCDKTAEVYDYENRIYRVDLTAQSNLTTFDGRIDLGFVIDVSASMKFPAKISHFGDGQLKRISQINQNNPDNQNKKNWEVWGLQKGTKYYIITDVDNTATMCTLYYDDDNGYKKWMLYDSSKSKSDRFEPESNHSTYYKTNVSYYIYEPDGNDKVTQADKNDTDLSATLRNILVVGEPRPRAYYLEKSIANTMRTLKSILSTVSVASGSDNPDVYIAYNTFCSSVNNADIHFDTVQGNITFNYTYSGGTRTDKALADDTNSAKNFDWNGKKKYAVLITDGAPQQNGTGYYGETRTAAGNLKKGADGTEGNADDVELITVGLSMGDVQEGKVLLYDIASEVDDEKAFYLAESDQLEDILLHILDLIMEDATVHGKVTDKVNEAFYPVDKRTGRPLAPYDRINLDGELVDSTYTGPCGVVQLDGRTIIWEKQDFTWDGWQGTVYVKAKEDLLGGNALLTNDGDATILAETYTLHEGGKEYPLATNNAVTNTNYDKEITKESPHVNVNELAFTYNNTSWTVYLGESVTPVDQLKGLYENVLVQEVVTKGRDTNNDTYKLPDTMATDGTNYYPLPLTNDEGVSDAREDQGEGTKQTYKLADLIREMIDNLIAKEGNSSPWKAYITKDQNQQDVLNWDKVIEESLKPDGLVIPYNVYGIGDMPHIMSDGTEYYDQSSITIKLTKSIDENEKIIENNIDITEQEHETEVVGNSVEEYTLTAIYSPDYDVLPRGQGGQSKEHFHVGTNGTMYQGSAPGTETSNNKHIINVYAQPLDVLKVDDEDHPLEGAEFKLYREAKANESGGVELDNYDPNLNSVRGYILVSSGTTDENGIVTMAVVEDGMTTSDPVLLPGITYYLIETNAPEATHDGKTVHYEPDRSVKRIKVETQEDGVYTSIKGAIIPEKTYPFNWEQGARISVDGNPVSVIIHDPDGEPGDTTTAEANTFVTESAAVSFRTKVVNIPNEMSVGVEKTWENTDNPPASITFKLYRTAYIPHRWDDGVVTKQWTCTEDGEITYTCHNCNETIVVPVEAEGHKAGEPKKEVITPLDCLQDEEYDMVTYCSVCGEELQRVHHTTPHTGHEWGPWETVTPASYDAPGLEMRICENNPGHVETREIPQLIKKVHITYRINTLWYHDDNRGQDLYYYQETRVTEDEFAVGSKINISWDDRYRYAANLYIDKTPESGWWYGTYVWFPNMSYVSANRSGSYHYVVNNITVTDDMVIDICLGTNNDATWEGPQWNRYTVFAPSGWDVSQPRSFNANINERRAVSYRDNSNTVNPASSDTAKSAANDYSAEVPRNAPAVLRNTNSEVMTSEELKAKLASCLPKAEIGINGNRVDDITYYEIEGTYEVTPDGQGKWQWSKDELLRFDQDGNEYVYYVVETDPSIGYETIYTGNGMHNGDTVTINNKLLPISIKLLKYIKGTQTVLPGATFTLTRVDENGNIIDNSIPSSTTNADGEITFSGLKPGRYKLEETSVPAGYITSEGPYYINVTINDQDIIEDSAMYTNISVSAGHAYKAENEPGAALPSAGGMGTNLFYFVGCIMTVIAGAGIVMKKRRKIVT